jgi:dipeptidyl aminopeptidase/acylaminoacyl peptidase
MDAREAYGVKFLSEPVICRDTVYFTEKWIEGNEYKTSIFKFENGKVERVTFEGKESHPMIIDDNLYYVKSEEKINHFVRIKGNTEPFNLFSMAKINKVVRHGEGFLVIGSEESNNDLPVVAKRLNYRFDTRGFIRQRKNLYLFNEKLIKIVSGEFDVSDVISNNDRVIALISFMNNDEGLTNMYEVDVKDGHLSKINEDQVSTMAFDGNGEVVYIGHSEGRTPWATKYMYLPVNKHVLLGKHSGNGSSISDHFQGTDENVICEDGTVYAPGETGGISSIYSIENSNVREVVKGKFVVQCFDVRDKKIAYIYSSQSKPSILAFDGKEYDPNGGMSGEAAEEMKVGEVEGWCMIAGRNSPNLVFVHGGPHDAYGESYMIEFQYFLRNGYNILFCNPRGSSSYGSEFAAACVEDWGRGPAEDIFNFIEAAKKKYDLTGQFGITGGSYGGYMTNWMITHSDFFKVGISERCVSNLMSMCGTSDIGFWFNAMYMKVEDPWAPESITKLLENSPITGIKKARTPTMFIHGENDYRCPIEQSEQMFVGLKMNGVDTELIRYQGDSHEHARAGKPDNMIDRLQRKKEWFDRYLLNH